MTGISHPYDYVLGMKVRRVTREDYVGFDPFGAMLVFECENGCKITVDGPDLFLPSTYAYPPLEIEFLNTCPYCGGYNELTVCPHCGAVSDAGN